MKELQELQCRFSSAKNLRNEFGGFNYRNIEEMAKALKPLLCELNCTVTFSDEIVNVGAYNYLKTTCTLTNEEGESVTNTAYAREDESRAGMCSPQLTGSASTYARKYCLCGLLFVDSGDDPDSMDNRPAQATIPTPKTSVPPQVDDRPWADKLKAFCTEQLNEYDSEETRIKIRAFYAHVKPQTFRGNKYGAKRLWEWFLKDVHEGTVVIDDTDPKHPKVVSDKAGK